MTDKERIEHLEAKVYELQGLMEMMGWRHRCPVIKPPHQDKVEAIERLNADILANYKAPVKFSAEGTAYVDSSVSAISPRRLLALIRAQMSRREKQQTDTGPEGKS